MLNKVTLIGRLGRDPEFLTTNGGISLAKFTVATDEKRKNENGETFSQTEWHRITIWRRMAEVARDYLRKGSLIYLEGKIHYDSYENKEGQKVYTTEIVCDFFKMLDTRAGSGQNSGGYQSRDAAPQSSGSNFDTPKAVVNDDGDLPF
jgi:single-strand DNA-binding protein